MNVFKGKGEHSVISLERMVIERDKQIQDLLITLNSTEPRLGLEGEIAKVVMKTLRDKLTISINTDSDYDGDMVKVKLELDGETISSDHVKVK
jgi:hypothetical protein